MALSVVADREKGLRQGRPSRQLDAVSFVCHGGVIEAQSMLLALTLRHSFASDLHILIGVPQGYPRPSPSALLLFNLLGAETKEILPTPLDGYPMANKIDCLRLLSGYSFGAFLDSDMIALAPPCSLSGDLSAVPASFQHFPREVWHAMYSRAGVRHFPADMPTLLSREIGPPYFNSGMISIAGTLAADLAECWRRNLVDLRTHVFPQTTFAAIPRFLEQASLTVTATALGLEIQPLNRRWNSPGWDEAYQRHGSSILYHYQRSKRLSTVPVVATKLGETLSRARSRYGRRWFELERFLKMEIPELRGC